MANKLDEFSEHSVEVAEEALGRAEVFFHEHGKKILYPVIAILAIVCIYFGYKYLYEEPRNRNAAEEMFAAEQYFQIDSLNLALNGNGQTTGFLDIIDQYSGTKSANLAKYYAGLCYLHMEQFDNAIEYLKEFKTKDVNLYPLSKMAIGDAYLELGNTSEAINYYEKAVDKYENDFVNPLVLMKLASVCEMEKNYDKALQAYERIQKEYTRSNEARDMDKYIARVKELKGE